MEGFSRPGSLGGEAIDDDSVEGHIMDDDRRQTGGEGYVRRAEDDDTEGHAGTVRRLDDDDTEGHAGTVRRLDDEDDTEGHKSLIR
jgi:hypothetical protein